MDRIRRIRRKLTIHKSLVNGSPPLSIDDFDHQLEHKALPLPSTEANNKASDNTSLQEETTTKLDTTSNSDNQEEKSHIPVIMGNTDSKHNGQLENEKNKKSKMAKMRSALKNAFNTSSKDGTTKSKKILADQTNNNNETDTTPPLTNYYYNNNNTRSATLPAHTNGPPYYANGGDTIKDCDNRSSTLQPRLLPAYNNTGIIGNIQNRQRIMSSSSYSSRPRTSSQSSMYSRRFSSNNRVLSTHIPEHIDKRLVRSRSVGVISDAEIKMRRTDSASVVKLADIEDWIV